MHKTKIGFRNKKQMFIFLTVAELSSSRISLQSRKH